MTHKQGKQIDEKSELNHSRQIASEITQSNQELFNLDTVKQLIDQAKNTVLLEAKDEISLQLQKDNATLMTIFGLFASILSFLTIEFQFLKTLERIEQIVGFTLLLFAMLFGFNIALDYLVKSRLDKETPAPNLYLIVMCIVPFVLGILFLYLSVK